MITVRQVSSDDWREWRDLRLAALSEAPYAFGSRLADWQGDGDSEQRWRERLTSVPFNVIADLGGIPGGMASGTLTEGDAELTSMWVAPFARGSGVGDALIQAVLQWASTVNPIRVILGVKEGNDRAIALYVRHGFVDDGGDEEASPRGETPERRMIFREDPHPDS